MVSKPTVKNLTVEDLSPDVKDPEAVKLLPTTIRPQRVVLELHDVNVAISNGIRRVLLSEYPTYYMTFDNADFRTNNPHTLNDYTRDRIKCIPILQSTNPKTVFKLNVLNNTDIPMRVKSGNIEGLVKMKLPFNETFDIAMLDPGKFLTIDKITIARTTGDQGPAVVANCASVALDQTPIDLNTGEGTPSSLSDPRVFRLSFVLNGTVDHKTLLTTACDEIIRRLETVIKSIPNIHNSEDIYYLVLPNETHTIGNIIVKGICEQYPDIPAATYTQNTIARTCTVNIRTNEDIETILVDVCKRNIKVLEELRRQFAK
jgi:DNA-directed RNA polymerase subunit L